MAQPFEHAVMTTLGIKLLNDAQAGECNIEFTRFAIGDGLYSEEEKERASLEKMDALKNEKKSYSILSKKKQNDNAIILTTNISNYDTEEEKVLVTEGFYINEIAVFARAKGSENEIMYSIAVVSAERGDYMPAYNGYNPAQIIQDYLVSVNNATDAQVIVKNGAYALQEDVNELRENVDTMQTNIDEIQKSIGGTTDIESKLAEKANGKGISFYVSEGIPYLTYEDNSSDEDTSGDYIETDGAPVATSEDVPEIINTIFNGGTIEEEESSELVGNEATEEDVSEIIDSIFK